MITDYDACCGKCCMRMHMGQISGGRASFGHGSGDSIGQEAVAMFVFEHLDHEDFWIEPGGWWPKPRPSDDFELVEYG